MYMYNTIRLTYRKQHLKYTYTHAYAYMYTSTHSTYTRVAKVQQCSAYSRT